MKIIVRNFIEGDTAVSYEDGKKCYMEVKKGLDEKQEVVLDFEGIDYVITAFLNPIIGDLIIERGPNIMKSISIVNAGQKTIDKIKMVKDGALLKREDLE